MNGPCPNRCCVLTPPGAGPIGVVRLIGPDRHSIIRQVFRRRTGESFTTEDGDRLRLGGFWDRDELIDDVIVSQVVVAAQPAVDIAAHGGVRIIERILQTLERLGAVVEDFSRMAGMVWPQVTTVEAECIRALFEAKTERAVRFLAWQRRNLVESLQETASRCRSDPAAARRHLMAMMDDYGAARGLIEGVMVALVGPPNGGKSTLFNRLVGRSAALVSARAGTTRDWVSASVDIAGVPITLIDTAGRAAPGTSLDRFAMEASRRMGERADLGLLVVDGSEPLPAGPNPLAEYGVGVPHCVPVINKLDLGPAWDPAGELIYGSDGGGAPVPVSARTGAGIDQLLEAVMHSLGYDRLSGTSACFFTVRQIDVARRVHAELERDPDTARLIVEDQLIGT